MSNYHGCKEEVTNKLNTTLFDIVYKVVKSLHLRKIAVIPNGNKLMFEVIFIFSDWILTELPPTPSVLGETDFQKILPGVLSGGLGHE